MNEAAFAEYDRAMARKAPDTCAVVWDMGCKSPAGTAYFVRLAECFKCGERVCTASVCSRRVLYARFGRKRLCSRCIEEIGK